MRNVSLLDWSGKLRAHCERGPRGCCCWWGRGRCLLQFHTLVSTLRVKKYRISNTLRKLTPRNRLSTPPMFANKHTIYKELVFFFYNNCLKVLKIKCSKKDCVRVDRYSYAKYLNGSYGGSSNKIWTFEFVAILFSNVGRVL